MSRIITYQQLKQCTKGKVIYKGLNKTVLSKDFNVSEFACPCLDCNIIKIDMLLVNLIQTIRNAYGGPIKITSGFRCLEHNRDVGGTKHSFHMLGKACDFRSVNGMQMEDIYNCALRLPEVGGLGRYERDGKLVFIHMDVRQREKDRITKWTKKLGPKQKKIRKEDEDAIN